MWFRRILCSLILLGLAACDEGPATNTRYVHSGGSEQYLQEATKNGSALPVVVNGRLFGDDAQIYVELVRDALTDGLKARQVRFSTVETDNAGFRVILVFGAIQGLDAAKLCGKEPPSPPDAEVRRLEILAGFCHEARLLSAVDGWAADVSDLNQGRGRELLRQIAQSLFVGDPDRR